MAAHQIRLILSDIDGTMRPYDEPAVSERAMDAIHAARRAGITFGPCTGRSPSWIAPLFRGEEMDTCVATNGLEVRLRGKVLRRAVFDPGMLGRLVSYVRQIPRAGVLGFVGHTPYLLCGARDDLAAAYPRYAEICVPATSMPPGAQVEKANAFIAAGLDETRAFVADLNEHVEGLDFDVPQPAFSNVMPAGINKATGIDVLAGALGISLDDVVVFGDGGNDVPMLEHVPNSVAVAGAQQEALDAARWHIGPCEDDAVARAIEALARGEWPFTG